MAFYLHQKRPIDLPIGVGQYINFQVFALLLGPHPGQHHRYAKPFVQINAKIFSSRKSYLKVLNNDAA
jgi:hypothetical protein